MSAEAKPKKHSFRNVSLYRKWVKERDKALEHLHANAQLQQSDIMRKVLTDALTVAKAYYPHLKESDTHAIDYLENHLKPVFAEGIHNLCFQIMTLRKNAYVLAKSSEAEIIAQLLRRPVKASVTRQDLHRVQTLDAMAGGKLINRVKLYMDKLRRDIISSAQTSALVAPNEHAFLVDVIQSFPRARRVTRPKRVLHPFTTREAAPTNISPVSGTAIDTIDDQAWSDMLDAYKDEFVPKWRAPEFMVDIPTSEENSWYAWELERDLTNEFVKSVRTGTNEAATENGITDFEWISVVDNTTDECCLWRDGLYTSEIQNELGEHSDDDDACTDADTTNPPIHFNCRCTLAPASDEVPAKPDDGGIAFDNWLLS